MLTDACIVRNHYLGPAEHAPTKAVGQRHPELEWLVGEISLAMGTKPSQDPIEVILSPGLERS